MSALAATSEDVLTATERLAPHVIRTPLLEHRVLNERAGGRVLLKAESLQHTGSFKFRGAMHRLLRLTEAERRAGVVAFSSGNHGQAVAAAGARLGIDVRIVMPDTAPAVKLERTRGWGAQVTTYDPTGPRTRVEIAREIACEEGRVLVPSYDDGDVIAGQGSAGVEIFEELSARNLRADALLVCCGGGGLTAGCALARDAFESTATDLHTVEPADFDDHARSFASGTREGNDPAARSICDALLSPTPGDLTFPITHPRVKRGLSVSDDDVREAMRFAFDYLRVVLEPGGAVALAAVLAQRVPTADRVTVALMSGGNVDPALFASVISEAR
ncbi:MAG: threonine/serine dehydratase [Pseudomonadota bacterium]|nr:threonine/serine dehydratase [Pseudomonadota bacterium]